MNAKQPGKLPSCALDQKLFQQLNLLGEDRKAANDNHCTESARLQPIWQIRHFYLVVNKMPYLPDLNTYLHESSLLIQAYPTTTRITTKYSLPRKPNAKAKSKSRPKPTESKQSAPAEASTGAPTKAARERLPPSATLTLKTFEPGSGICLKYKTDKAAEVGRLLTGLGRLAGGEVIEMPAPVSASAAAVAAVEDKMEIDEVGSGNATPKVDEGKPQGHSEVPGGGGKGNKKKGKK